MFNWGASVPTKTVNEVPNIPSFYRGQHIFVTGATGYLGKAVIEKLLRCCSDVDKITILLRQKRNKDIQKRLQEYLNHVVFERVKREKPGAINKVEVVSGDLMAKGLGLSPEDRLMLEEKVSVIFHSGASVRFDDPLKKALAVNTRGTLEIVNLAKKMTNLKVLLHVSTAYCNCDTYEIDEVVYPAPCDWKMLLAAIDQVDDHTFNILTSKIMGRLPNTYTFTKALAEQVVNDAAKDLPVVIFRPTIVLPALQEPYPGWVDNFNGPVGLVIAGGLSLTSVGYADPQTGLNCVPVDQVTNAMLVSAWEKAVLSKNCNSTVINVARSLNNGMKFAQVQSMAFDVMREVPCGYGLWTITGFVTCNIYKYYFYVIFCHFLLGLCLDFVLKWIQPNKISLVKLYRKIHHANISVKYFSENEWDFKNEKMHWLRTTILPEDRKIFDFGRFEEPLTLEYAKLFVLGGRRFLLKEPDSTLPDHVVHLRRMIWVARIYYFLLCLFLCWVGYRCYLLYYGSDEHTTQVKIGTF